jgi:peptidyl-Lys metalloendopeptidase
MRKPALFSLTLLALLSTHCWMKPHAPLDAAHPLECRVEAARPRIAGAPIAMRFQLTNRSEQPLWMLRWNTPWDGWRGTIFDVSFQGQDLPYQGAMVKRGDPTAEEYVKFRAGESMIIGLDLSQAYDMSKPGTYRVKVVGNLQDVIKDGTNPPRPRDRFQPMELKCEELTLEVVKGEVAPKVNY